MSVFTDDGVYIDLETTVVTREEMRSYFLQAYVNISNGVLAGALIPIGDDTYTWASGFDGRRWCTRFQNENVEPPGLNSRNSDSP